MAYSRFYDNDLYMYPHVAGYIECCACILNEPQDEYSLFSASLAIYNDEDLAEHIDLHASVGHNMPSNLLQEILADPDRYRKYTP